MDIDVTSAVVRALSFVAQFQAAGAAFFLMLFLRDGVWPTLTTASAAAAAAGAVARLARRFALAGLLLVLIHQFLDVARMSGEFSGMFVASMQRLALTSATALANALRVIGLLMIISGLSRAKRAERAASLIAVVGGAMVCAAFLLVGHTSISVLRWLLAPLLLLHLVVVAGWFGALLPLCLVVRGESAPRAAAAVEAFSRLAMRLVPLILVAGAGIAFVLLPGVAALGETYGLLLLAKVAGFALLMLLAALNKWRLAPALVRGDGTAARTLTLSMCAEWLLIAAVLCVTAVLTTFYSPES